MITEFHTLSDFETHLADGGLLTGAVFQALDLRSYEARLLRYSLHKVMFLGCDLTPSTIAHALNSGACIFPKLDYVPYQAFRGHLYTPDELFAGYQPNIAGSYDTSLDGRVYVHFTQTGHGEPQDIFESLARRLHDHSMNDALRDKIADRDVVAIMGGHSMLRDDPSYLQMTRIAAQLTAKGYLMASGGGPGAMEATHVGAWFAYRSDAELQDGVKMLSEAPLYKPKDPWLDTAAAVKHKYPLQGNGSRMPDSLGIPTWLYGHEPPTMFATDIAKYFANSVREDGLLAIAKHGVVFSPGSAGTIQEVFQDAAQNHYETYAHASPMVFFGKEFWTETKPVYPLLAQLAEGRAYKEWLLITDSVEEAVAHIQKFSAQMADD